MALVYSYMLHLTLIILFYNCVNSNEIQINKVNYDEIIKPIFPYFRDILSDSSDFNINLKISNDFQQYTYNDSLCQKHFTEILKSLQDSDNWARKFIDAWGKIPAGIYWGHLVDLGHYEECINIEQPTGKIRSQYCLATILLEDLMTSVQKKTRMDSPIRENDLTLTLGVCVPVSCSPQFLETILKDYAELFLKIKISPKIRPDSCSIKEDIKFKSIDIIAIVFFSMIASIMILSTIYDYWMRKLDKSPIIILIAFSILTNGEKLFKFPTKISSNQIGCLNGIRCLSIIWVVYGHSYYMTSFLPIVNLISIKDWMISPYSMFLQTATVSVDSFFFLSGFLVSWIAFREMEKNNGKLNIFLMYFHRYIRLTPIVAVAILFNVSMIKYLGNGPFWNSFISPTKQFCEENWWTTLLYINNYIAPEKMCLGHTWYLSVDTQLFLISPLILIPTHKWGKKFLLPTALLLGLLSIGCTFANFVKYDFSILMTAPGGQNHGKRMTTIYYPTHNRYAPWLVGIVGGYFMYKIKDKSVKLSNGLIALGWVLASIVFVAVIFGPYSHVQYDNPANTIESAFYESLSRVSWTIALLWIVFACQRGYGGFVNSFLSYTFWQVFARITYAIYITHVIVEIINGGNTKTDTHFSDYDVILRFWSDFGLSILISIVAVLAFESPIIGIEKAIFHTQKRNSQTKLFESNQLPINKFENKISL